MLIFCICSCQQQEVRSTKSEIPVQKHGTTLKILGIAQDAGYPQINCKKDCCIFLWNNPSYRKMVSCLGIQHYNSKSAWLFDATPDIKFQLESLLKEFYKLNGIFLTHAHIGHYTGLMELGREAMGADAVPVYAMPKMKLFLENNGPWSQLVTLKNIEINELGNNRPIVLNEEISVIPMEVPHRDEFSETVGFIIRGPHKRALFIPDINKWNLWDEDIVSVISEVDYAFIDGSFYKNGEIPGRDMSEIPHPFIEESMELFSALSSQEKNKIHFIHLNHTNPAYDKESEAYKTIISSGFHIAEEFQTFDL